MADFDWRVAELLALADSADFPVRIADDSGPADYRVLAILVPLGVADSTVAVARLVAVSADSVVFVAGDVVEAALVDSAERSSTTA